MPRSNTTFGEQAKTFDRKSTVENAEPRARAELH